MFTKKNKKVIATISAAIIALTAMPVASYATNISIYEDKEQYSLSAMAYEYACKQMPFHLETLDYDMRNVSISNVFPIYQNDSLSKKTESFICFAIEDNIVVGDMIIWYENGEFNSSFGIGEFSELKNAFLCKSMLSFVADEENIYMATDKATYIFASSDGKAGEKCTYKTISPVKSNTNFSCIQIINKLSDTALRTEKSAIDHTYTKKYPAKKVGNVKDYDGHAGICWAACIASKVMYEKSSTYPSLTAEKVHDDVKKYNNNKCPSGKDRYRKGMETYGMKPNTNSTNKIFSLDSLIKKCEKKNLVIMRLETTNNHAVLFVGCNILYDANNNVLENSTYKLMDPNLTTKYRSVTVNKDVVDGKSGFSYKINSSNAVWFDSMYEV